MDTDILHEIEKRYLLASQRRRKPAITIDSIYLDWDLPRLYQEELLSFFYISGVEVFAKEERGQLNLTRLFDTGEVTTSETEIALPELPIDLEMPVIDIKDTALYLDEAKISVDMESSLRWNEGENLDLQLQRIQADMPEIGEFASRIDMSKILLSLTLDISHSRSIEA